MAVILMVDIPEMTTQAYKEMHGIMMTDGLPEGMISHSCRIKNGGVSIIDIWESKAHINDFIENLLVPAMHQVGEDNEPEIMLISDLINADASEYTGVLRS